MIDRQPIIADRVRNIAGSFAFIEHRFLQRGLWAGLSHHALLLYFFLVLAADRRGLSFYGYDRICSLLGLVLDEYLQARDELIDEDLVAFDGRRFQVLSLPERPRLREPPPAQPCDLATIKHIMNKQLRGNHAG
jgi:hypothetical protein